LNTPPQRGLFDGTNICDLGTHGLGDLIQTKKTNNLTSSMDAWMDETYKIGMIFGFIA